MEKFLSVLAAVILTFSINLYSGEDNVPDVYLLTCGPGTETYSRWGHSALRIVDHAAGTDRVYNWGIFDFSTPAFAWKFARGRLEYMLGVSTYERFIQEYFMEGRWVQSQKVNLESHEVVKMLQLIEENLKSFYDANYAKLSGPEYKLSPTELKVAQMVRDGKTNKEIAKLMHLSKSTILTHRHHVRAKLGIRNKKVNLRSLLNT